jgi:hypothetical protein
MTWGNHFLDYIYNGLEQQTAYQTNKPLAHSQVELSCIRLGMAFTPTPVGLRTQNLF